MTITSAVVVQLQEEEEKKDAIMRNKRIDDERINDDGNDNDDDDEERGNSGDYFSSPFPKTFKTTNNSTMNDTVNGGKNVNENDNKDDNGNDDYIINSQGNIVHDHKQHNDGSPTKTKQTKKNNINYRKRKCGFHILPKSIRNRTINFLDRWPRLIAIITRNLLMYSLIIVTLIGGYIMSIFEGPVEIIQNDLFLQKTWILKSLPIQETTAALVGLPTTCLIQYINLLQQQDTNITIELNSNSNSNNIISNNTFYTDPQQMFDLGNFPTKTGSSSSLSSYLTDANVTWKGLYTAANNNNTLFPNINIGNNGNIGGIDSIDFDFILDPSLLTLPTLLPPKTETENETTSSSTDLEDDSSSNTTTVSF